jgi:hypothetical protein
MGKFVKKKKEGETDFKISILWLMHFGGLPPELVTCKDCADYKAGACKGGKKPVECMIEKSKKVIFF